MPGRSSPSTGTTTRSVPRQPDHAGLAVSLTPPATAFPPGSPVDPGMQWLVDFDDALCRRHGAEDPAHRGSSARPGFDRIFVYGLRPKPRDGTARRAGSDRLPRCSTTITTPTASRSCRRARRPTTRRTRARPTRARIPTSRSASPSSGRTPLNDGSGRRRQRLRRRARHRSRASWRTCAAPTASACATARDMLTALWPATLGYFLKQMMADVFTPDADRDGPPVRSGQRAAARAGAGVPRRPDALRRAAGHLAQPLPAGPATAPRLDRAAAGRVRPARSGRTGSTAPTLRRTCRTRGDPDAGTGRRCSAWTPAP